MGLKDKAGLIALAAGVLSLIGWCTPYIWVTVGPMSLMVWSWGLTMMTGFPTTFAMDIMVAGILIIIGAILAIATGYLGRKREELKTMGIIWLVSGILVIVGVIIPLAMMGMALGLSIGFFLPLIGGIVAVIAGAAALFIK